MTLTDLNTGEHPAQHGADDAGLLPLPAPAQDLLFRAARTANAFTTEPVGEEQVRAIYDLVKYAPTALNSQPLRVTLVRSAQARERLVKHLAPGNQAKTAAAPLVAVLTADRAFHRHLPKLVPHNPAAKDAFADAPRREAVATFNASLQMGYFIVGVRAAGLAAGPMTGFDAAGLEADLFPSGDQKVLAVVNIGRPAPDAFRPRAPRLDFDEVVTSI